MPCPETFAALSAVDWERHRHGRHAEAPAKAHGRLEHREIDVVTPLPRMVNYPAVRQIARVVRHREQLGPAASGTSSAEEVFLVTSLPAERASPAELLALNRGHRAVENANHRVRDTTLGEDACLARTGNGPVNRASLDNIALAVVFANRRDGESIAAAFRRFQLDTGEAIRALRALRLRGRPTSDQARPSPASRPARAGMRPSTNTRVSRHPQLHTPPPRPSPPRSANQRGKILWPLLKFLSAPAAFVAAFMLIGAPSAFGVSAVETVAGVSTGIGGCALAYAPGDDPKDLPNPGTDDSFDDFMCMTAVVAGAWAVRGWYTSLALVAMGGVVGGTSLFVTGAIGAYGFIVGLVFCGEN